jgi:hypothetical protein
MHRYVQVGFGSTPGEVDLLGTNTHRATHRSNADSTLMATARMVEVDLDENGSGAKSPRKKGRAPAVLVGSPTGDDSQVRQCDRIFFLWVEACRVCIQQHIQLCCWVLSSPCMCRF